MSTDISERFARAVGAKDVPVLLALLDENVDFKGMTPGRFWEAASARELVEDVIFGSWFEPKDHIEAVEHVETGSVADRHRVGYRLRVTNPDGRYAVEQQAYLMTDGGRITWLRIMCSGFRPTA